MKGVFVVILLLWLSLFIPGVYGCIYADISVGYKIAYMAAVCGIWLPIALAYIDTRNV